MKALVKNGHVLLADHVHSLIAQGFQLVKVSQSWVNNIHIIELM
jgi:hypothetical protein